MAIERTVHADGSWTEKATTPQSAKDLADKHGPALQKRGADDFHKKWIEADKVGYEKLRDPSGKITHVRADEADSARRSGYGAVANPTMVVPELPWHKDREPLPGRRRWKYNRETGQMEET